MREITCCFTGHRAIPLKNIETIEKNLAIEVKKLILQGVNYFLVGGAIGFDTIAATTILKLRVNHPQVKLILILPCENQPKNWLYDDVQRYRLIKSQADMVKTLSSHYYKGCMHVRNRYMVDSSAFCIGYLTKNTGGTAYTLNYAREKGLKTINIASKTILDNNTAKK